MLHMLVHVFHHHNGRVHHGADGNGDPPQRHDIGVNTHAIHNNKGNQNTHRQRENNDQGGTQMEKEDATDQRHHQKFLDKLAVQGFYRTLDKRRAVIGFDDFHAFRQTAGEFLQLGLGGLDGFQRILTEAHNNNAADHFTFAVQFGNTATQLRPQANLRHILEQNWRTLVIDAHGNIAQIIQVINIAGRAHHVFGLGHFNHRTTDFLVTPLYGPFDLGQWQVIGAQAVRIEHHLVLLDHATDGHDFGHTRHGLQFVFQEPVLDTAQLGKVVSAGTVNQGIFIDPADTGRVRPELGPGRRRQLAGYLAEIFQHARARPVHIGTVLEDNIDIGIAEEGITTHIGRLGHRQHGRGQRIGHLVFHHLWRLPGKVGFDNHLHIGKVRQRIERYLPDRINAGTSDDKGQHQHHKAVVDGPFDKFTQHDYSPLSLPDPSLAPFMSSVMA